MLDLRQSVGGSQWFSNPPMDHCHVWYWESNQIVDLLRKRICDYAVVCFREKAHKPTPPLNTQTNRSTNGTIFQILLDLTS